MGLFEQLFPRRPLPRWSAEDFKALIPGNTVIAHGMRQKAADMSLDRFYDQQTETELTQFSCPWGLPIKLYIGHTQTNHWYLKSSVGLVLDSSTGRPVGPVEAYLPISGPNATEHELFVVARRLYLRAYEHEAEENFRWNGEQVLNPHDPEAVKRAP